MKYFLFASLLVLTGACSKKEQAPDDLAMAAVAPSFKGTIVHYLSGEDTIQGYLSKPAGAGPFPAIIVIHEWWGLNDWAKEQADLVAEHGYIALAVDLYRGKVASDRDMAHELSRALPEDRAAKDIGAAMTFLKSQKDVTKIGSLGWCMGGGYSLTAAITLPELAACVVNYGRLVEDKNLIRKIQAPILGIFGGLDRGIPADDVRKFEQSAKAESKTVRVIIYDDAGHGFINATNAKGYNKNRAEEAWKETWSFLEAQLKK